MRLADWWLDYRIKRLNRRAEKLLAKCRRLRMQGKACDKYSDKLLDVYATSDELVLRRELRR